LIGFLNVCVLYTIIPIKEFPPSETTEIRQETKVAPINAAVGFSESELLDPFIVAFMFAEVWYFCCLSH